MYDHIYCDMLLIFTFSFRQGYIGFRIFVICFLGLIQAFQIFIFIFSLLITSAYQAWFLRGIHVILWSFLYPFPVGVCALASDFMYGLRAFFLIFGIRSMPPFLGRNMGLYVILLMWYPFHKSLCGWKCGISFHKPL